MTTSFNFLLPLKTIVTLLMVISTVKSNQRTLKVVIAEQPPFIERFKDQSGQDVYQGICIDLIEKIAKSIGFNYTTYVVPDGVFFSTFNKTTGKWNGMIAELVEKRAHIALAPIVVMADQAAVVDFTVPFYDLVGTTLLMRKKDSTNDWFLVIKVFQPLVWLMILGAYFITAFFLWLFERYSPHSFRNDKSGPYDPHLIDFNWKQCLWFCLILWSPQGPDSMPKNTSGRFLATTWYLFGFFVFAVLTSNYAALLFVPDLEFPIKSIDDLALQYKIKYAPVKGSPTALYFERMAAIENKFNVHWKQLSVNGSKTPEERAQLEIWDWPLPDKYNTIWKYMKDAGLPLNRQDAIARVEASPSPADGFVFVGDAAVIRYEAMTNCKVEQIGNEISMKPYALATQRGDPLNNDLSMAILKLRNERSMEQLKTKWWDKHPRRLDCPTEKKESDGLQMDDMIGIFIIQASCLVLFFIVFGFEFMAKRSKGPSQPTVTPVTSLVAKPVEKW